MDYKTMITDAQRKGLANEQKMWRSVEALVDELNVLEEEYPEMYWRIMRKQHAILFNRHYNADFAEYDVQQLSYTDKDGKMHTGPHWTKAQVTEVTRGLPFPQGVTDCDKYVALNVMYSDLCKEADDEQVIRSAWAFFFSDEDWPGGSGTKTWDYMCSKNMLENATS